MSDESDKVRKLASSFLVPGTHPNLRMVAQAALRVDRLEAENKELRDRNASKRSENVLYVKKLDEARHVVDVMHRTYHTGVSECPCMEVLGGHAPNECAHGVTLVGVVERCAECDVELSHRPPEEAYLRDLLSRVVAVGAQTVSFTNDKHDAVLEAREYLRKHATPETEVRIREWLADVYSPEGVEHWLTHPHRLLDGECAIDVIRRGEGERVWTLVEQLVSGAFI